MFTCSRYVPEMISNRRWIGLVAAAWMLAGGVAAARGASPLPDPALTPGAINPAVREATIGATICRRGWTRTVRPPVSYTEPLKKAQIRRYGYADAQPWKYEEDHLLRHGDHVSRKDQVAVFKEHSWKLPLNVLRGFRDVSDVSMS